MTFRSLCSGIARTALGTTLAIALLNGAQAAALSFAAVVTGMSDIVEVIHPAGPVVRVQTLAGATGVFDMVGYRSTDVVNLATGAGTGSNVFENADGDELFGNFVVQLIPTDDVSVLNIVGLVNFAGGSGRFEGATGAAEFAGIGQFISATQAVTRLAFSGELNLVPAPGTLSLLLLGSMLAAGAAARQRAAISRSAAASRSR